MANDYFNAMLSRRVRTDGFIDPCIPTLAAKPPSGPDWVHEIERRGRQGRAAIHAPRPRLDTPLSLDRPRRRLAINREPGAAVRKFAERLRLRTKVAAVPVRDTTTVPQSCLLCRRVRALNC
jgi:hypothetical protein